MTTNEDGMKYSETHSQPKKTISETEDRVIISLQQDTGETVCEVIFNKNYLKHIGQRYEKEDNFRYISTKSIQLENVLFYALMDVQEVLGLTKYEGK